MTLGAMFWGFFFVFFGFFSFFGYFWVVFCYIKVLLVCYVSFWSFFWYFQGFFSKSLLYGFFKPLFFGYLFGVFLDFFCHFWGFLIFFCILVGPF